MLVALITLGDPGRLTGGYLYHRRMAEAAPRHDARIAFVSFPERPFPLAALDAPRVLREAVALGAQALLLDSIAAAFLGPWLRLRRPDRPLIGMLHQPPGGIDHGPLRTALQAWLDRLAYRYARRLLVASDALAAQMMAEGVPRERLRVVPPGRDVAAFVDEGRTTKDERPKTSDQRRATKEQGGGSSQLSSFVLGPSSDLRQGRRAAFLCVGNWVARKGIHDLLNAFARLPADAATLHLAGDDHAEPRYAARLRARLARPDLAGRVVVHGPLAPAQVAALYAAADAFVLPSRKEPYGTVYGEAMAAGLPVVGWRAGNLPYLADDEREGLLVEPGDLAGLVRAMQRLADDEALRQRLGAAAGRRAQARPTWEQAAALFFEAIREVVAEHR